MIDPPRSPAEWRLVLVTDPAPAGARSILDVLRVVLEGGGVDAIVLRLPGLPVRDVLAITTQVRPLSAACGAALLTHDRADLALGLGTDGVHLPSAGLPPAFARDLLPANAVVGVSCHSVADVVAAERGRADYVFLGPVWTTPSKERYGAPLGLDVLRAARSATAIPMIAIGSVTEERAPAAVAAGASGVAVIRAVCDARDPLHAALALRDAVRTARATHVV